MTDVFKEARERLKTPQKLPLEGVIIAVDFDSTCALHEYPAIGAEIPDCIRTLKDLLRLGAKLILLTVRCGVELMAAVQWLRDRGVELWGINHNPTQYLYSSSRKVFADLYIDDCGLGIPLRYEPETSPHPFVDWKKVRDLLEQRLNDVSLDMPL